MFVKGMIMGAANVFPISSGTVSLVLGVFERFINSINSLRINNFKLIFQGEFRQFVRRTDFKFFLTIVLGLLAGMVLTSIFLKQTLNSYKVYTWSFFIGLIIASVIYVMKSIDKVNVKNILLVLAGMAVSFFLSIKSNPYPNESFLYLFLCGIIGATGMVVPGESTYLFSLPSWNSELVWAVVMAGLGFATVFILELLARHSEKKKLERLQNPKPKRQKKHKRQKRQQKRHGKKARKN